MESSAPAASSPATVAPFISQMTTDYIMTPFCFPPSRGALSVFVFKTVALTIDLSHCHARFMAQERVLALQALPKALLFIAVWVWQGELSPMTCTLGM